MPEKQQRLNFWWIPVFFVPITILIFWYFEVKRYYLCSVLLIFYTLIPVCFRMEKKRLQAREVVLYAVMCAIAVASRAVFVMIPVVKPIVGIIMITGMALGAEAGFFVGAMSAFVSNFLFGQGPWTPWQMFAYGIAGFLAGILAKRGLLKSTTPIRNAIAGAYVVLLVVGPLLDTCSVLAMMTSYTIQSAGAVYAAGIPLNILHAAATALTLGILSKPMMEKLERIKIKYGIEI